MEVSTETWRVKHPKNWMTRKNDRGDENFAKEDESKRKKDATLCFWFKKSKCRSNRNPSIQSLATSLNENCCLCVGAFARYLKEVFKCLYCMAFCQLPYTEFEKLFCEWLEASADACHDLVYFVRKILKIVVGLNSK